MQIFREPRITLLARQQFLGAPHIRWQSDTDVPAQVLAEFAGRICYLSFGPDAGFEGGHKLIAGRTSNADYVANILEVKHGSVIEHAVWTFLFEGVSRALTHELVRHRHLSFSQLSQRYVDESEVAFVLPPEIQEGSPAFEVWRRSCERANDEYRELLALVEEQVKDEPKATLRRKRARQTARSLLPNAAETKIVVTGNARAWRHFIELRASATAETEIRRLALAVLRVLQQEAPALFGDFRVVRRDDGTEIAETDHPGV
ncbi:MAG TPA: FAD-dependent thymidylate synthase [Longimicrobiales bacterium]|nr:FAD-dependent thymidylate synthase [Longimicrobiales bacterium]